MTKSTAVDSARHNVRVNCICRGTVDTPMIAPTVEKYHRASGISVDRIYTMLKTAQPVQRVGTSEEVARDVCLLLSDESPFMTGALLCVDGGYTCQ